MIDAFILREMVRRCNHKGLNLSGRSAVILPYLTSVSVTGLPTKMLHELKLMVETMLQYKAFEIVTIHDSFAAHANNVNWVRHWYKEILAELAESEILSDIMGQLHGCTGQYQKLSSNLADYIRDSNYSLS
ncbi:MAG: hypothetical protein B7X50_07695 [Alishewanella sp. 34-51-39]|nr:MAG: hypothetical protein B7X50_07695 [Alishewanella sp. 34-51-39]